MVIFYLTVLSMSNLQKAFDTRVISSTPARDVNWTTENKQYSD